MTTVLPAASAPDDDDSPYDLFVLAIKAKATRDKYAQNLKTFMDGRSLFLEVTDFEERCREVVKRARSDPVWLDRSFRDFCIEARDRLERKQVRPGRVWNIISAIRLFFSVNDFDVTKWKKYTRGIPFGRKSADDLIPFREQIVKMAQYPDRRIKVIAYCMGSGGWRVGAWEYLRWGNFTPIYRDLDRDGEEELVACKVLVYAGEDEQYYTFITPEAYMVTKDWMDFRERSGEPINRDSWILRDLWNDRVRKGGNHQGARIDAPKRLSLQGIETQLNRAWATQGVRKRLEGERRRHEFSQAHVFRKYFKTMAEGAGMKSINVETLMGHSIGVSDSYYRPREDDLLMDYFKAVSALTFERADVSLHEVQELKESEVRNTDAIAALVEEVERQKEENAALKSEVEKLKRNGGSAQSMTQELDRMAARLEELRKLHKEAEEKKRETDNFNPDADNCEDSEVKEGW